MKIIGLNKHGDKMIIDVSEIAFNKEEQKLLIRALSGAEYQASNINGFMSKLIMAGLAKKGLYDLTNIPHIILESI